MTRRQPRRSIGQFLLEALRRTRHRLTFGFRRHVLQQRFIEKRIHDYRLLLDASDPGISAQLFRLGEREAEQKFILEQELQPGMTAFDLGANVGYYTIMMALLVGRTGRVHAVEPYPANFTLLQLNVRRNGVADRVALQETAIGKADGTATMHVSTHSNWHSLHPPAVAGDSPWKLRYRRQVVDTLDVPTRSLASYLAGKAPPDLLRMDIEGYEVEVLRGVLELPKHGLRLPGILFETHPEFYHPQDNDLRAVLEALCSDLGFEVRYLISDFHFGSKEAPDLTHGSTVFERYGYGPEHIRRLFRNRAIYHNLRSADAIDLICTSECVHAAFLAPRPTVERDVTGER